MARIVSLGSALQDVYLVDHDDFGTNTRGFFNQIELGAKIDIDTIKFSTGGGATNAATTFARSGHESIFMGCIANDPAGQAVLSALDQEGIDSSYVAYTPKTNTGYSVLLLTPSGERSILTCRGASAKFDLLNADDLDNIYPDWLYATTLRGDMQTLDRFFTKAKSLNTKIMFNPGNLELDHPRKLLNLLTKVDILLVNRKEAQKIVPGSSLPELIHRLKNYVPTTIITDGSSGAIASHNDEIYRAGLYEDIPPKDTTGAGDAFGSGFLANYANTEDIRQALTFAAANSTNVIRFIGSKAGIISNTARIHSMPIQLVR